MSKNNKNTTQKVVFLLYQFFKIFHKLCRRSFDIAKFKGDAHFFVFDGTYLSEGQKLTFINTFVIIFYLRESFDVLLIIRKSGYDYLAKGCGNVFIIKIF